MSRKQAHWIGWTVYYVGRFLQLLGLLLVTRAVFMSSSTQLRVMLVLTGAGVALFVLGWLLIRGKGEGAG